MKTFFALFTASILGLVFALPAPQQLVIELDQAFSLSGLDTATLGDMTFSLESVTMTGENPQVMVALTTGESEETATLMLELPMAASVKVGDYTLTLLSASVPENQEAMCGVSSATLVLDKPEKPL